MIIGGLWWIEQWHKAHKKFYGYADDSPEGQVGSVVYAIMTGVAPAVAISASPYGYMQIVKHNADDYLARRGYQGRHWAFDIRSKRFTFSRSFSRRLLLRGGAKLATRAIPVVGWALFAWDMWLVGKWIGRKTNPFD